MDQFKYKIGEKDILVYRSVYAPVKSNMFTLLTGEEAVVFDPNVDEELLHLFEKNRIKKVNIFLTHGHYDHISGVEWLKEHTEATVFCQSKCADRLANSKRPLARLVALVLAEEDKKDGGHRFREFKESYRPFTISADKFFEKEEKLTIGNLVFDVTSTPGHTDGSACYKLFDTIVFTGDSFLLDNSNVTRFPGGNKQDYEQITLRYIRNLSPDIIIMPGHGDPFILKDMIYKCVI